MGGRAAINESQIRKYSAQNEQRFADHTVSKEDLEAGREADRKRKQQQDSEMSAFNEAQQQATEGGASKPAPNMFVKGKAETKTKKMPGFVVKKLKTDEESSVAPSGEAAESSEKAQEDSAKEETAVGSEASAVGGM